MVSGDGCCDTCDMILVVLESQGIASMLNCIVHLAGHILLLIHLRCTVCSYQCLANGIQHILVQGNTGTGWACIIDLPEFSCVS